MWDSHVWLPTRSASILLARSRDAALDATKTEERIETRLNT